MGTHDATNSFKAYDRAFVQRVGIESDKGFEIGIELVTKARRHRQPVAELPTIWLDRTSGCPTSRLWSWIAPLPAVVPLRLRQTHPTDGSSRPVSSDHFRSSRHVLVIGSSGFIGGYVVQQLLADGHEVIGVDNFSKYGKVAKSYDDHPDYRLVEGDCPTSTS